MGVMKQIKPNRWAHHVLRHDCLRASWAASSVARVVTGTAAMVLCVFICLLDDHRAYSQRAHLSHGHRRGLLWGATAVGDSA